MKSYCPSCGAATEYSGVKPKFCASCGNPFSVLAKKENKNYEIHEDVQVEEVEDDEEITITDFSNISKLEVDIENNTNNSITFGQLAESYSNVQGEVKASNNQRPNTNQQNTEDFLNDFQQEAGTLRNNNA